MTLSRRAFIRNAALTTAAASLIPTKTLAGEKASSATAIDYQDWGAVQGLFNTSPDVVHAALFFLATHPQPVRDEISRLRRMIDANPLEAVEHGAFIDPENNLYGGAVGAIARYIGANPNDIALTSSTTHGLAVAYQGLRLKAGDEVLTTAHDHYSQLETVRLACDRSGATRRQVRLFPGHDASGATIESIARTIREAISPSTRVVGITWVHSSSGLMMPLKEVADVVREANASRSSDQRILLLVDGVHGLGSADRTNVVSSGVDIFVSGMHKWMFGPRGTGFVWARSELWDQMDPITVSYDSGELYYAWLQGKDAPRPARARDFGMSGFQAYEHVWAIPAAVEMHEAIGPDRVRDRILALNGHALDGLAKMSHIELRTPRDASVRSGICAFEVAGRQPSQVVRELREKGVVASTSPYSPTYVRLSFGIANSEADVDAAVSAVASLS